MRLYTIGFTKKSAEGFFETLRGSGAQRIIDVRLNNVSQLAGFTKRADLEYFLRAIPGIPYSHELSLAPTQELLAGYRKVDHDWDRYADSFLRLLTERRIEDTPQDLFVDACLLCSEQTADRCHRRLVAEYLRDHWGNVDITHL